MKRPPLISTISVFGAAESANKGKRKAAPQNEVRKRRNGEARKPLKRFFASRPKYTQLKLGVNERDPAISLSNLARFRSRRRCGGSGGSGCVFPGRVRGLWVRSHWR